MDEQSQMQAPEWPSDGVTDVNDPVGGSWTPEADRQHPHSEDPAEGLEVPDDDELEDGDEDDLNGHAM